MVEASLASVSSDELPGTATPRIRNPYSGAPIARSALMVGAVCAAFYLILKLIPLSVGSSEGFEYFLAGITCALTLIVLFYDALPIFRAAWRGLRMRQLGCEYFWSLAVLTGLLFFGYALVVDVTFPAQQPLFDSLLLLVFLSLLQLHVQRYIAGKLEAAADFDLRRLASTARIITDEAEGAQMVPAEEVQPGTTLLVEAGEVVACDGIITDGIAEVEERHFSGYAARRIKNVGQEIYAGSTLLRGRVKYRVTAARDDSALTNYTDFLKESLVPPAGETKALNRLQFTAGILLTFIAMGFGVVWGWPAQSLPTAGRVVSSILLLAPLLLPVFAVPLYRKIALTSAFRHGVLLRSPSSLERLNELEELVIDFSFDDPPGRPEAVVYEVIDSRVDEAVLKEALLALLSRSDDELHRAIARFLWKNLSLTTLHDVKEFGAYPGGNIIGTVQGAEFSVGSEAFLIERGVHLQLSELDEAEAGSGWVYVALRDEVIARIKVANAFAADGALLAKKLQKYGVRTVLFSRETADALAPLGSALGLEESAVNAGMAEGEYRERLEVLPRIGLFANHRTPDAAIKSVPLSISVFDPYLCDVSRTDVTLFTRDLQAVVFCIGLAKRFWRLRKAALSSMIGLGTVLLLLAALGIVPPVFIAAVVLASLSVMTLYLLRQIS